MEHRKEDIMSRIRRLGDTTLTQEDLPIARALLQDDDVEAGDEPTAWERVVRGWYDRHGVKADARPSRIDPLDA